MSESVDTTGMTHGSDEPRPGGFPATHPDLAPLAERYTILAELGRGGMGIVYKVRDRETDEVIAIKVLQPAIAARPKLIERFKAELRLARKITHKNVCRVYDLNRFEQLAAISMEFVEGDSLRGLLDRVEGLSVPHGLKILRQILSGLAEAHAQGVVHRDLKPENILIAGDGTVKVMDFGVARLADAAPTLSGGMIGTPAYMSPEQAGGKDADARSDIYSLGLVIYEMFTGQPAFRADTPVALAIKQMQEIPPAPLAINPYLPEFLDRVVRKCVEKDPARRFQSVAELESAMKPEALEAHSAEPASEIELPAEAEPVHWQRSDSWLMGGATLGAIVFLSLFSRVYPFTSLRIQIGPEAAVEKAVALVRQFEPAVSGGRAEPSWRAWLGERPANFFVPMPEISQAFALITKWSTGSRWWLAEYPARVRALGLAEANRQLSYDEYWTIQVDLGSGRYPAFVKLRADGSLRSMYFTGPGKEPLPQLSSEQAAREGAGYVKQLLGADVRNLKPEVRPVKAPAATLVTWVLPGPIPDLRRIIRVWLRNGLLEANEDAVSRRQPEIDAQMVSSGAQDVQRFQVYRRGGTVWLAIPLLMLCLAFVRRLYHKPRTSSLAAALCGTLAIGGMWVQDRGSEVEWLLVLASTVGFFLFLFLPLASAEDYLWRRLRSRVVSWFFLIHNPREARAAGLSVLRGCSLGLIYLAIHTLMMYGVGSARLAGPSTFWMEAAALSGRSYLGLYALSWAVLDTILRAWYAVGFPAALAAGVTRRPLVLIAVPAVLSAFFPSLNLPGTSPSVVWLQLLLAVRQGLAFSFVFYRYDLLTLACGFLTVGTWLLVYPVWTVFSAIQPWQSLAMLPWFLLIAVAATIYLRPQLHTLRRQFAAAFE